MSDQADPKIWNAVHACRMDSLLLLHEQCHRFDQVTTLLGLGQPTVASATNASKDSNPSQMIAPINAWYLLRKSVVLRIPLIANLRVHELVASILIQHVFVANRSAPSADLAGTLLVLCSTILFW